MSSDMLLILSMISEILSAFFFPAVNSDISIPHFEARAQIVQPSPTLKPSFHIPEPSKTPKPSKTPRPSKTPKATLKPKASVKPSAAVEGAQVSGINVQSVLQALNEYRGKNGVGGLAIDSKLQEYAQSRADYLRSIGKLDKHAGHQEFMASDGFSKLGFNAIAENQGYNYKGDAKGLIESFYGKSSGHDKNQLSSEYTHVGIGVNGQFTNLVFGGRKR